MRLDLYTANQHCTLVEAAADWYSCVAVERSQVVQAVLALDERLLVDLDLDLDPAREAADAEGS